MTFSRKNGIVISETRKTNNTKKGGKLNDSRRN
nr:MAG TPA: hypothetical protein [Podoviridae sp. ctAV815]